MSSNFNFEQVRKFFQDPHLAKINDMSKRIAVLESDNIEIKTEDVVGRGDSDKSWLLLNDNFYDIKKYTPTENQPIIPNEPDFNFMKCHLKFNNFGNTLYDYSGFGHNFEIIGEPCATTGINQGLRGNTQFHSLAHTFEGNVDNVHYENYENSPDMKILGLTTGISYVFFVNAAELDGQGTNPCLFEKMDDTSNRVRISWQNDGQLKFLVKRAGTDYKTRTNTASTTLNTDYIFVFTYAVSGNVSKIYINGVDTTTTTSSEGWNGSTTTAFIGISGNDTNGWFNPNFIQDFRIYRERVLTQQQVTNLQTNKVSITQFPFGQGAISDHCICPLLETESFTDTSFTTTSYTAGA